MVDSNISQIVSIIAAFLTTASFLPQAIKTIKTKNTSGISLIMYLMFVLGVFLWAIFGIMIGNYPLIIANVVTFVFAGIVLAFKVLHHFRSR